MLTSDDAAILDHLGAIDDVLVHALAGDLAAADKLIALNLKLADLLSQLIIFVLGFAQLDDILVAGQALEFVQRVCEVFAYVVFSNIDLIRRPPVEYHINWLVKR
jgi:uncharacterized membrane protein YkvA (DUF1232 family)